MALNLSPGEQVIFQGHPSWRAILGFYLKGILVAAIAGVLFKLFGSSSATVFLVVLVIVAATVLIGFVKRVATTYTITDRRLNIKRGIVSREVQETRLERVQNVNYKQSVYQRAMQIGGRRLQLRLLRSCRSAAGRAQRRPGNGRRRGRLTRPWRSSAAQLGLGGRRACREAFELQAGVACAVPAALFRASARSVRSQVKVSPSRPKCP